MERNDENLGNIGSSTNAGEGARGGSTGGYGNTGDLTGSAGYGAGAGGAGASGAGAGGMEQGGEGFRDRARDMASNAGDRLADVGSTIRDRAGNAKNSLADMLEKGAQRLSSQGGNQQFAGAAGAGATGAVAADGNRLSAIASGMQSSADWLREADLDGMRTGIENQVRNNPGRSLLIAVGVGYLLGKALRR